jgi:hypothetical protein
MQQIFDELATVGCTITTREHVRLLHPGRSRF